MAVIGLVEPQLEELPTKLARCEDCHLPYQHFGMDVTLPNDQWTELTGYTEGEGLLCGACILQRGIQNEKYGVARLRFE